MDEDIDDLLAEIEGTLSGGAAPPPAATTPSARASASLGAASGIGREPMSASFDDDDDDDIDSLLKSVESTMGAASSAPALTAPQRSLASAPPSAAHAPSALSTAPPRVDGLCYGRTAMRCTRCDFRVLRFVDRVWAEGVDYMFFRNFMPDAARMLPMLLPRRASDAFACQCLWATVERDDELPHPQWRVRGTLVPDDLVVG